MLVKNIIKMKYKIRRVKYNNGEPTPFWKIYMKIDGDLYPSDYSSSTSLFKTIILWLKLTFYSYF